MEPTEHFGMHFGYIRRLFQSWVSPFNNASCTTRVEITQCLNLRLVLVILRSPLVSSFAYVISGPPPPPPAANAGPRISVRLSAAGVRPVYYDTKASAAAGWIGGRMDSF